MNPIFNIQGLRLSFDSGRPINKRRKTEWQNMLDELGQVQFVSNISCLYPVYVRGEAYLAAGQGSAAAAEFQKILDHSGIVWNCWTGALAHLGVACANALESRTSQERMPIPPASGHSPPIKIFSHSGKTPIPKSPSLKQAKAEYEKLQ